MKSRYKEFRKYYKNITKNTIRCCISKIGTNRTIPSECMRGIRSGPRPPDRDKAGGEGLDPLLRKPEPQGPRPGDMKPKHGMSVIHLLITHHPQLDSHVREPESRDG